MCYKYAFLRHNQLAMSSMNYMMRFINDQLAMWYNCVERDPSGFTVQKPLDTH